MTASMVFDLVVTEAASTTVSMVFDMVATNSASNGARDDRVAQSPSFHSSRASMGE